MLGRDEIFGLVHPYNDVHTLGIYNAGKMLQDCGYKVFYADELVSMILNKEADLSDMAKKMKEIADRRYRWEIISKKYSKLY